MAKKIVIVVNREVRGLTLPDHQSFFFAPGRHVLEPMSYHGSEWWVERGKRNRQRGLNHAVWEKHIKEGKVELVDSDFS